MAERVEFQLVLKDLFSGTFGKFSREARQAERDFKGINNPIKSIGGGIGMLKGALAGLAVFEGVKFAGGLVADMEQAEISFRVLTGSAEKSKMLLEDLTNFAAKTPFEFPELQKSAQLLLNFGVQTENILPLMQTLGDLSGGSAEKLDSITLAYGKIMTKGKASMEELNMLIEGGQIPIMQELAKITGKNGDELFKMVSNGEISSKTITQAFANMTSEGGMFYKMMEEQSNSFSGQLSTLMDELKMTLVNILKPLLPVLKQAIGWFNNFISWIKINIEGLKQVFMPLWEAIEPIRMVFEEMFSSLEKKGGVLGFITELLQRWGLVFQMLKPLIRIVSHGIALIIKSLFTMVDLIWKAVEGLANLFGIKKVKFYSSKMKGSLEDPEKKEEKPKTIQDVLKSMADTKGSSKSTEKSTKKSNVSKLVNDISGGSGVKQINVTIGSLIKENNNIINNIRSEADIKVFLDTLQTGLLKVVNDSQIAIQ
jgi:tape measure domain-containing protein